MTRALSQGGSARTADMAAVRQAAFCFQEGHEEGLEGGQEDRLLTGQGHAGSDQDGVRCRVQDMPMVAPCCAGRGCTVMVSAGRHVRRTVRQMMVGFQRWMARPTPEKRTPAALSCSEAVAGLIRAQWRDWEKPLPGAACVWQKLQNAATWRRLLDLPVAPRVMHQFVFLWAGKPRPPFRHRCPRARDPPTSYCGMAAARSFRGRFAKSRPAVPLPCRTATGAA